MTDYAEQWYWCDVVDGFAAEEVAEPQWEKIPAERVERVRRNWEAQRAKALEPVRCQMWGPQIPWYQRQRQYRVTVCPQ